VRPGDSDNPARVCSPRCPGGRGNRVRACFGAPAIRCSTGWSDHPAISLTRKAEPAPWGSRSVRGRVYRVARTASSDAPPRGRLTKYHNRPDGDRRMLSTGWFTPATSRASTTTLLLLPSDAKKESIRRRGENISPWEIETAVNRHRRCKESAGARRPLELRGRRMSSSSVRAGPNSRAEEMIEVLQGKRGGVTPSPRTSSFGMRCRRRPRHRIQYAALQARRHHAGHLGRPLERRRVADAGPSM